MLLKIQVLLISVIKCTIYYVQVYSPPQPRQNKNVFDFFIFCSTTTKPLISSLLGSYAGQEYESFDQVEVGW